MGTYHSTSDYVRTALYFGTTCSGPVIKGGVVPAGVCRPEERSCTGSTLSVAKFEKFTSASGTITTYKCENGATDCSCAAESPAKTCNTCATQEIATIGSISGKATEGGCASGNSGISSRAPGLLIGGLVSLISLMVAL